MNVRPQRLADATLLYVSVALVATLVGGWLLGLWAAGFETPNSYVGDSLFTSSVIKGIIENGQPYTNPRLGAPGTQELYDFPGSDTVFTAEIWLLGRLTQDYAVVLNLFALLTYPLIALAGAWSLRRLGFSRPSAFVFALLYACLPFHQSRITGHQYLSAYFIVPLAVALIATQVFRTRDRGGDSRPAWRLPVWAWFVIAALGACGIYYAYFALVLTIIAGVVASYSARDLKRLVPAAIVVVGVVAVLALQYLPSYLYWERAGENSTTEARQPFESDLYALRMSQLVFPVTGHRIGAFAGAKQFLRDSLVTVSENFAGIAYDSSLGIIGVLGFFILLFWLATAPFRAPPDVGESTPAKLAVLGIGAFLLATVGGVGELVAFAGFPQIRAYDRITPYIGFVAFGAVAWLADTSAARIRASRLFGPSVVRTGIVALCFALVLAGGLFDQSTSTTMPDYKAIGAEYRSDAAFVADVESVLPADAVVFQLPYVAFPESAAVEGMTVYDPLRMYLHSRSVHWSAGAFRGREDADWQASVSAQPAAALVDSLRQQGFDGIVVDRAGYADGGERVERELAAALGHTAATTSPDARFAFFAFAD